MGRTWRSGSTRRCKHNAEHASAHLFQRRPIVFQQLAFLIGSVIYLIILIGSVPCRATPTLAFQPFTGRPSTDNYYAAIQPQTIVAGCMGGAGLPAIASEDDENFKADITGGGESVTMDTSFPNSDDSGDGDRMDGCRMSQVQRVVAAVQSSARQIFMRSHGCTTS